MKPDWPEVKITRHDDPPTTLFDARAAYLEIDDEGSVVDFSMNETDESFQAFLACMWEARKHRRAVSR